MNNRPNAQELLAIARDAFTTEILPALPDKLRYTGLMIANALAIARREIEAGEAPARAEFERLLNLVQMSGGSFAPQISPRPAGEGPGVRAELAGNALATAIADYNRRLATEIRAGRFDEEERTVLLEHLRQTTEAKLAISNPKALDSNDQSQKSKNRI